MKRGRLFFRYEITGVEDFYLIERLSKQKIAVFDVEFSKNKIILSIDSQDRKKFFAISRNMCYNIRKIKYYGKLSPLKFLQSKIGIALCFVAFAVCLVFLDGFISKIEYVADGKHLAPKIEAVLRKNGVGEKTFLKCEIKTLENAVYLSSERISFVSIEKKGRILIVDVRLTTFETEPIDVKKERIISTVSGEVVALNVFSGTAVVKVGDKVQKGGLLIDGYYADGEEHVKTYALGEVLIKAEFKYDYKSFATGEKYKNRAIFLAKESLKSDEVVEASVERTIVDGRAIYSVTLYYLVTVG